MCGINGFGISEYHLRRHVKRKVLSEPKKLIEYCLFRFLCSFRPQLDTSLCHTMMNTGLVYHVMCLFTSQQLVYISLLIHTLWGYYNSCHVNIINDITLLIRNILYQIWKKLIMWTQQLAQTRSTWVDTDRHYIPLHFMHILNVKLLIWCSFIWHYKFCA